MPVSEITILRRLQPLLWLSLLMLTACSQPPNYAPVKVVNQSIPNGSVNTHRKSAGIGFGKNAKTRKKINAPAYSTEISPLAPHRKPVSSTARFNNGGNQGTISANPAEEAAQNQSAKNKAIKNRELKESERETAPRITFYPLKKEQVNNTKTGKKTPAEHSLALSENKQTKAEASKYNSEKKSIISDNNKKVLKLNFEWPIKGKVIKNFVQSDRKGIDIAGKPGQTVRAAEAGKAVYCGQGLAGYGQLIILKHNPTYLSAYAHNSEVSIQEGQKVEKGQPIGTVGRSGLKKSVLHFEIRKNGISINPLALLPDK